MLKDILQALQRFRFADTLCLGFLCIYVPPLDLGLVSFGPESSLVPTLGCQHQLVTHSCGTRRRVQACYGLSDVTVRCSTSS